MANVDNPYNRFNFAILQDDTGYYAECGCGWRSSYHYLTADTAGRTLRRHRRKEHKWGTTKPSHVLH